MPFRSRCGILRLSLHSLWPACFLQCLVFSLLSHQCVTLGPRDLSCLGVLSLALCSPASKFSGNDWGNTSAHFGRLAISGKKMPRYAYLAWKGWLAWVEGQHHFNSMAFGSKPKPLRTTRKFLFFFIAAILVDWVLPSPWFFPWWIRLQDRDGLLDFSVLRCRPASSCPAGFVKGVHRTVH